MHDCSPRACGTALAKNEEWLVMRRAPELEMVMMNSDVQEHKRTHLCRNVRQYVICKV